MTRFLYDRLRAEVAELRRRLSVVSLTGGGGGGGSHASSHEDGGADEIDVTGLSGVLADPQTPAAHAATHSDGGGDDVSVLNLAGYPGGATTFLRDDGTFAAPTAAAHAASHQNGGGDEINVGGLSGQLADAQLVGVRKNSAGSTFTRQRLNFIEGSNVTLTVADDVGNGEVDITIESTGPGSPSGSGIDELTGHVTAGPGSGSQIATLDETFRTRYITVTVGGAGVDITTGPKSVYVTLPAGTLTDWRLVSPDSGNIVIDVLKGTFAAFPTMSSITGTAEPELSGVDKDEDTTAGWTTSVSAGDILDVDVISCSGITRATLVLTLVQP